MIASLAPIINAQQQINNAVRKIHITRSNIAYERAIL